MNDQFNLSPFQHESVQVATHPLPHPPPFPGDWISFQSKASRQQTGRVGVLERRRHLIVLSAQPEIESDFTNVKTRSNTTNQDNSRSQIHSQIQTRLLSRIECDAPVDIVFNSIDRSQASSVDDAFLVALLNDPAYQYLHFAHNLAIAPMPLAVGEPTCPPNLNAILHGQPTARAIVEQQFDPVTGCGISFLDAPDEQTEAGGTDGLSTSEVSTNLPSLTFSIDVVADNIIETATEAKIAHYGVEPSETVGKLPLPSNVLRPNQSAFMPKGLTLGSPLNHLATTSHGPIIPVTDDSPEYAGFARKLIGQISYRTFARNFLRAMIDHEAPDWVDPPSYECELPFLHLFDATKLRAGQSWDGSLQPSRYVFE